MASKYETLVGSVINDVLVVSYKREPRTSKTGRNYTVGRLNVCYVSNKEAVLNISISSFNKWSFIKNLDKLNGVNSSSSKKQQTKTKTKTKQQTKTTSKTKRKISDIDVMCDAAHTALQDVIEDIKLDTEMYVHDAWTDVFYFNNMDENGNKVYKTPEEMYKKWCNIHLEHVAQIAKEKFEQMGYMGDSMLDLFTEVYVEVSNKEYKQMLKDWVYNNWHVFEQKYQKAWERKYMSSTKGKVQNEFVVEFKGCTTVREVKQVYRRLAKLHHSDTGGSDEKFKLVHEAYEAALKRVA